MNIPERWIAKLDMLPPKDFKTLMMAILKGEHEPEVSPRYQPIASDIYADIGRLKRDNEYQKKHRSKSDSQTNVRRMSDDSQTNVRQEERKEVSPPCSPSSFPPHPLINSPHNPPLQEKREEALTGVCAGACAEEQIPFTAFEPLDPIEAEIKHRKPTIAERFEALWAEYPKKQGKKNAFESYQRAIRDGVSDDTIADGIRRYKDYIASRPDGKKYTLDGSTYFCQRRWEDEYETSAETRDANSKPPWMSQEDWEDMNAVFG